VKNWFFVEKQEKQKTKYEPGQIPEEKDMEEWWEDEHLNDFHFF
jgi:hypothetical protein